MTRRCSHCSNNGHNSRTCPSRGGRGSGGVRLFGVRLTDGSFIKKSASMGNLSAHYHSSSSAAASPNPDSPSSDPAHDHDHDGYLSDDPVHASCSTNRRGERKKGVPWTEEEHRLFLMGLHKLGKGDWRGIAKNFVMSRTPTQVASHAQKYFIRQTNVTRRKRRSSLFDMIPDGITDHPPLLEDEVLVTLQATENENSNLIPSLNLLRRSEFEPMEATPEEKMEEHDEPEMETSTFPPMITGFFPAYLPLPFPFWAPSAPPIDEENGAERSRHEVLKPIPLLPKQPVNVDEIVGLSQLSLVEANREQKQPAPLSLRSAGEPSRQSAFHPNARVNMPELDNGKTDVIQAN